MKEIIADTTVATGKFAVMTAGIVALTLSVRSLINFGKEFLEIFGITGIAGILTKLGAAFTAIKLSISSVALSLSAMTGGAMGAGALLGGSLIVHIGLAVGALWGLKWLWRNKGRGIYLIPPGWRKSMGHSLSVSTEIDWPYCFNA